MFPVAKNWFISIKIAIEKIIKQLYNVIFFNIYCNSDYISLLNLFSSALFCSNQMNEQLVLRFKFYHYLLISHQLFQLHSNQMGYSN